MVEHNALQLKVLTQERQGLDIAFLSHQARTVGRQVASGLWEPQVASLQNVLVAVGVTLVPSMGDFFNN